MKVSVIVCAAGKGERAGFEKNKLLTPFMGANALYYAVKRAQSLENFFSENNMNCTLAEVIVTSAAVDYEEICAVCAHPLTKVVLGGGTRTESVYNALKEATGDIVLIQDGARPFTTVEQYARCIECVKEYGSAVVAMPATDTVATAKDGWVAHIPARNEVFAVQTPQGFYLHDLLPAYQKAIESGETFTDDGSVYSRFVSPARVCPCGTAANKKLTYKEDFAQYCAPPVTQIVKSAARCGFGADVHAFGKKQDYITLCGCKIPCDCGLVAHSDGDAALHAVMDALLSAAGLYDIGHYFPDDDPKYDGADSGELLKQAVALVKEAGFIPCGLSVAIQAEKPRLAPHMDDMKARLCALTGIAPEAVAISAGTCEGLGFVGEKRGVCVYCVAQLSER